jgi:hypothetical protein
LESSGLHRLQEQLGKQEGRVEQLLDLTHKHQQAEVDILKTEREKRMNEQGEVWRL